MKLFISLTSVYARKVRIVVREKGLTTVIDETVTLPVDSAPELVAVNPLSQIPALVDETGQSWTDSSLIAAWLDDRGTGPRLFPDYGSDAYWRVRRIETAAMGMIEMMAKIVYENRRPETERSPFWLRRWEDNLVRAFRMADAFDPDPAVFDMGTLTLAIAGTFCDFRLGHVDWRKVAPRIAAVQAELEKRQSFIDTYPR